MREQKPQVALCQLLKILHVPQGFSDVLGAQVCKDGDNSLHEQSIWQGSLPVCIANHLLKHVQRMCLK